MLSSSFNSFTRRFTSVFEPVTPVCSLNALAINSASAGSGVIPPGWTLFSGSIIPFVNDGIRKYFRYPISTTLAAFRTLLANRQINYATNGGMTHIMVVRMNASSNPATQTVSGAMILPTFSVCPPVNALVNGGTCVLGTGNAPQCPSGAITFGKNRFIFIAHTLTNGATSPTVVTYLDGIRFGVTTSGYTNMTNVTTGATDSIGSRNIPNVTGTGVALDYDLMYFAHYDRPLSDNDIKRVFNSIAPVMETAAPLYTTVTPFTSISVPSAPLFEFNAYGYTQTNGQSYVAGTSGWVGNGVQSLNWSVDGVGRRYLNFNTNNATLTKSYTVSSSMFTNQGYSFVLLVRLNQFTNGGQNALFSTALAKFYLNYEYSSSSSGQFVVPTFLYLTASSTLGGQQNADMADTSSFQTVR